MRIWKRKNKRACIVKWFRYLVAAYLLASWGVNGVINPLHYFENISMQKELPKTAEDAGGFIIECPQDAEAAAMDYLSFQADGMQEYSFEIQLSVYLRGQDVQTVSWNAWKGWNYIDLHALKGNGSWEKIVVTHETGAGMDGIRFRDVMLSGGRKVDTKRMAYMFASFLFLAAFWECVWWVKERYAQ